MTSLSMQLPYRHVEQHCVKDSLIMTRTPGEQTFWMLWRHIVTWRHRWRHHSNAHGHFPIGSQ